MGEAGDGAQGKYCLPINVSECCPGRGDGVPGTDVGFPLDSTSVRLTERAMDNL